MVSAATTVAMLARLVSARQRLVASYVPLVQALQAAGHKAFAEGFGERERELMDWVQVGMKV